MTLFACAGKNVAAEKKVGRRFLSPILVWIILGLLVFCGAIGALVRVQTGTFDSHTSAVKGGDDDSTTLLITIAPTAAGLQFVDGGHADGPNTEKLDGYPIVIPAASPASPPASLVSDPTPAEPPAKVPATADIVAEHRGDDPSSNSMYDVGETIFYAIGDVPYDSQQADILKEQMLNLASDCEFVIHVGDIRHGGEDKPECRREEYQLASDLLRLSSAPVFIIIGDNDWTDCPNPEEGLALWNEYFVGFETKYWNHTFNIQRHPSYPQNFAFEHKGTLFMGLNIIGGEVHDQEEWTLRLTDQYTWLEQLVHGYVEKIAPAVGRVVIFEHANLNHNHRIFEDKLIELIQSGLKNKLPMLVMNGDIHEWSYDENYMGEGSFLRIMVSGLAQDPPLKMIVNADGSLLETGDAFAHDRMLRQ